MAPNLFLAAQTACQPHKWFRKQSPPCQIKQTEEWSRPIPGRYRHTSRGWYLVAKRDGGDWSELDYADWERVTYWQLTHRYELLSKLNTRSQEGFLLGKSDQKQLRKFYCMPDDNATWVQCWNKKGEESIPGPYQRFVLDGDTRKFRPMTKGDERSIRRLSSTSMHSYHSTTSLHTESLASSLHPSRANTPSASRKPSTEFEVPAIPQDKRSSLTVPMGAGSGHRSRSTSPSPLSTPVLEKDLEDLNAKLKEAKDAEPERD